MKNLQAVAAQVKMLNTRQKQSFGQRGVDHVTSWRFYIESLSWDDSDLF